MIFFVSGVREVPPGGIELHIGFLHALEECGGKSIFPKANACFCQLVLPVLYGTYIMYIMTSSSRKAMVGTKFNII